MTDGFTSADNPPSRAELVALELLRRTVADLPQSIARNIQETSAGDYVRGDRGLRPRDRNFGGDVRDADPEGGRGGRSRPGLVGTMGGMLAAKFSAVLGPLAIFSQTINSAGSGFQVLGKVVQVIGGLFASFLLPAIVVIAGALLDWADEMEGEILGAAKGFARFIMTTLVPAIRFLADNFELLAVGAAAVLAVMNPLAASILGVIALLSDREAGVRAKGVMAGGLADVFDVFGVKDDPRVAKLREWEAEGRKGEGFGEWGKAAFGVAGGAAGGKGKLGKGAEDVLASLRMSLGARPMNIGLGQVYSSVSNQIAGTDPIEARILATLMKSLGIAEDAARDLMGIRKAVEKKDAAFGAGDFGDF